MEALVVKMADWVELILFVREEWRSGNRSLDWAADKIWVLLRGWLALKMKGHGVKVFAWYCKELKVLRVSLRDKRPGELVFGDF